MAQSLSQVLLHVVFSTKNRAPWLKSRELRDALHGYLVGTLHAIDCPSLIVNSVADHLHCLLRLSRTVSVSDLIKSLKIESSSWVKQQDPLLAGFFWQAGYGAFSVSKSNVDQVMAYIANQEEHHRQRSFQDEFRALLKRHGIDWDERYVWE